MTKTTPAPDYLSELFPRAGDELLGVLAAAAEHAGLVLADFQSVRDLVSLPEYDDSESLHVLLLLLLIALEEGSLCIELSEEPLTRRLADLGEAQHARSWAQRILSDLEANPFPELIGDDCYDHRPVIRWPAGNRCFLYFQKYLLHELTFRTELDKRLSASSSVGRTFSPSTAAGRTEGPSYSVNVPLPLQQLQEILNDVLEACPLRPDGQSLRLDRQQRRALELALREPLAIISGGPGTGKTSIVLTLLRCLVRAGVAPERIALAAPTGRAAQRLTDAMRGGLALLPTGWKHSADGLLDDVPAGTLHHLLRYNPHRGTFGHHPENPVPADVVIVDEVSMVGVALMAQLLQALRPDARLVLLGDKDQLPSVDAGAVLGCLVDELGAEGTSTRPQVQSPKHEHVVILEENYRSQPAIREVARAINRQDASVIERLPALSLTGAAGGPAFQEVDAGVWLLPIEGQPLRFLRRLLQSWAERQYLSSAGDVASYQDLMQRADGQVSPLDESGPVRQTLDELFHVLGQSRLLTLLREGPWGCVGINQFFDEHLRPRWDRNRRGSLFAGAPVLITRNDHGRQLFNGDVGIALHGRSGGLRVVFPRADGYESFPADTLPAHELGFALTIHKSQGSEYGQVLLTVPPEGGRRLLTKEIIYTGITRAKNLALLCGTKEALRFAVSRKIVRESGMAPAARPQSSK